MVLGHHDPRNDIQMNTSERAIIGALIDGDAEGWKAAMTSLESGRASRVMMTTFANACFRKFPESVSDDDIATYVRELRERHLPGADLGIVPTKMAIRGVLGKPGALNGISATDLLTAQIVITNDVAQEYSLSAAIFRKWSEDPSLQTVVDYVAEIDRRFPAELPVARTVLETVIRRGIR